MWLQSRRSKNQSHVYLTYKCELRELSINFEIPEKKKLIQNITPSKQISKYIFVLTDLVETKGRTQDLQL